MGDRIRRGVTNHAAEVEAQRAQARIDAEVQAQERAERTAKSQAVEALKLAALAVIRADAVETASTLVDLGHLPPTPIGLSKTSAKRRHSGRQLPDTVTYGLSVWELCIMRTTEEKQVPGSGMFHNDPEYMRVETGRRGVGLAADGRLIAYGFASILMSASGPYGSPRDEKVIPFGPQVATGASLIPPAGINLDCAVEEQPIVRMWRNHLATFGVNVATGQPFTPAVSTDVAPLF
jgi:hypothetical protein